MGITLKVGEYNALDMNAYGPFSGDLGSADIVSFTSTKVVGYVYGTKVTIAGSGFRASQDGYILGGTINSVTETYNGKLELSLTGLSLSVTKLVDVLETYPTWDDRALVKQVMSGNDKVYGSNYADVIRGEGGNDALAGSGGNDKIYGNAGNDKLAGGLGADDLFGGSGADTFAFHSLSQSKVAASGRDSIFDFSRADGDKIDLSAIDAITATSKNDVFTFIGTKTFSGKAGELRYELKNGDTYIFASVDKDNDPEFAIHLDDPITLKFGDFIL